MIELDHICVMSSNLFECTYKLSEQTGVGNCDGGFFPELGLGQKVISLGGDVYVEIESIVNYQHTLKQTPMARMVERQTRGGDCLLSWCLRTDDPGEIEAFGAHLGIEPKENIQGGKFRMSGPSRPVRHVPDIWGSWVIGKPNVYLVTDKSAHSSRLPIQPGTGTAEPRGVTALEIGGAEEGLRAWLGPLWDYCVFPFEIIYNGRQDGLYAVTFDTSEGSRCIQLNPVLLPDN